MKTELLIPEILKRKELIFLGVFSFLTRFLNLNFPSKVVFDETFFGLFATKYLSHQYYFDIHPPLGKMLLALVGFLGKIKPGFNFALGSDYGDFNFLCLRFLPAFLGALLVLVVYFFVQELGFSKRVAFLSAFLILFDNALTVQSKFILLDIILVFFIFLSLYLFFLIKKFPQNSPKWYLFNFLTGLSLGSTISIKWTGLAILMVVWFLAFDNIILKECFKKENVIKIFSFLFLPFAVYFLVFVIHFSLLPLACNENCGAVINFDLENINNSFYQNIHQPPKEGLIKNFLKINKMMLISNLATNNFYYFHSPWYSWPFMISPVYYLKTFQNDKTFQIVLFGNPIVWWLGIIGVIGILYLLIKNYLFDFKLKLPSFFYSENLKILLASYFMFLVPFLMIKRFLLIYHYFPALIFSIIIFAVFLDAILKMMFKSSVLANSLLLGILIFVFLSFLFFSPFTYGFPLDQKSFQLRIWLPTWEPSILI